LSKAGSACGKGRDECLRPPLIRINLPRTVRNTRDGSPPLKSKTERVECSIELAVRQILASNHPGPSHAPSRFPSRRVASMETLSLNQARTIIAATLAEGRSLGLKPLSVAVLDSGGHVRAFEREDGASTHRFQIAHGKAHGAIALGLGSRSLMARAEQQPYFVAAVTSAIGGAMIPVPGGVLVTDTSGQVLGAVGVTGDTSDNDERAAVAGITAAGLIPKID